MLKKRDTPCLGCEDRKVTETYNCHNVCEKYISFCNQIHAEKEAINKKKHEAHIFFKGIGETKLKALKRKAKKPR